LQSFPKIILGIDPGTIVMGYGVISITGKKIELIEMGVLKLATKDDAYERLQKIYEKVCNIIAQHQPTDFAIEAPFFGKNVQSMLKLGRAQGVAIAAAMHTKLPVCEYSPRKIKQAITGNGNASKEQVLKMLQEIVTIKEIPAQLDATDALAVAICHHFQVGSVGAVQIKIGSKKPGAGWESFVKDNPERVR
jgi:crossover junction endodeoxyribonuclease RuvC